MLAADNRETVVDAPVVIFEVLSPSTARTDRFVKAREYQAYALRSALRHARTRPHQRDRLRPLRQAWTHEILIADSLLALPEIGVELPLAELYEGIVFEAEQDGDQPPAAESVR